MYTLFSMRRFLTVLADTIDIGGLELPSDTPWQVVVMVVVFIVTAWAISKYYENRTRVIVEQSEAANTKTIADMRIRLREIEAKAREQTAAFEEKLRHERLNTNLRQQDTENFERLLETLIGLTEKIAMGDQEGRRERETYHSNIKLMGESVAALAGGLANVNQAVNGGIEVVMRLESGVSEIKEGISKLRSMIGEADSDETLHTIVARLQAQLRDLSKQVRQTVNSMESKNEPKAIGQRTAQRAAHQAGAAAAQEPQGDDGDNRSRPGVLLPGVPPD